MSEFQNRLRNDLEPILASADPRQKISAYHDMPYALFRYDPEEEFELRGELTLLETRLEQKSKRVIRISLADCLFTALGLVSPLGDWFEAERAEGVDNVIQTISNVLESHTPLVDLVAGQMPADPDPKSDVVLINRTGALFPVYRTFSLLEQLKGRVVAPTVLFYPGHLDGASGLRFMDVLDAEHNYRPKIF
ncbi:BREX protein BrxB domain-containing protein [uncultured Brevundimonas sp.]|uniref:BREX protein BrxB domain-containing protein n=1 Tax=uncultured Brevundimonas sp. TaxID=213418 RepID=UPI0025CE5D65|nr:BREX protein BrxB domain-containing protein [uncultured Brevundimonas sp.]